METTEAGRGGDATPSVFTVRPALPAFLAASLILGTSITSVALTYAWQGKWREIESIPFVSEAHYDELQSPIFAAMTALSSLTSLTSVLLTYLVTLSRRHRWISFAMAPTPADTRPDALFLHAKFFAASCLHHGVAAHKALSFAGLVCGLLSSALLFLAGAVSVKRHLHQVVVLASLVTTILWTVFVSLTLKAHAYPEPRWQAACRVLMWLCSAWLVATSLAIPVLAGRDDSSVVLMEYLNIAGTSGYFLLVCWRLRKSRIHLYCN